VLETLKALLKNGWKFHPAEPVEIFYGLNEKLRAGVISNMYDIAQSLLEAGHLISP